jgi:hypothetical protein
MLERTEGVPQVFVDKHFLPSEPNFYKSGKFPPSLTGNPATPFDDTLANKRPRFASFAT